VPLVVAKGIEADKKPPIVTVFSKRSLLKFKRLTARERDSAQPGAAETVKDRFLPGLPAGGKPSLRSVLCIGPG